MTLPAGGHRSPGWSALAIFKRSERIRFRSSSNAEDSDFFSGAGLYESFSGCLLDDLDGDLVGPSHCDPTRANERGVFRSIGKVYASFYNDNAFLERLRLGIDENEVGMAILVHHSVPDEDELANGVASVFRRSSGRKRADLVTQAGAVSVTNPDGNSIAEEVRADEGSSSSRPPSVFFIQPSNLVLLGDYVIDWRSDYETLAGMLFKVARAYSDLVPGRDPIFSILFHSGRTTTTTGVRWSYLEFSSCEGAMGLFLGSKTDPYSSLRIQALPSIPVFGKMPGVPPESQRPPADPGVDSNSSRAWTHQLASADGRTRLGILYRSTLLEDVIPFWLKHGIDAEHGGILTALDQDGSVLDTDKSVWFQGRAAWMFATLFNTVERREPWLEASRSCIQFLRRHGFGLEGKMWFTVTREGKPLRMRRYVFSEAFAAIANAAFSKATGDSRAAEDAVNCFATYLHHSFTPGVMPPKCESTRPTQSIGPHLIGIVTAQELRANLGDVSVTGRSCTEWIDHSIAMIKRDFLKPEHQALMEIVGTDGQVLDHVDGRTLNPGHALECAWFVMHEGALRKDSLLIQLGTHILDWMWARGWDKEFGGLFYFRDVFGKPVQEYWHDMKFWWPHCETLIATLLAWRLTGDVKYARWHGLVHDWSFAHFPDPAHGEWFGYLHRDGRLSQRAKGNLFKGPFHLPRMLWLCEGLCREATP